MFILLTKLGGKEMLKQKIECTFNSMDINKDIINLNSKDYSLKKFTFYHETLNSISKRKLYLNNNGLNYKLNNKKEAQSSKIIKLKPYKSKLSKKEKIEESMHSNLTSNDKLNNKKLNEIIKLKASFDEVRQRFNNEFSSENDVLYKKILKLSDKLDRIFDASIKIKE
jgi:hypothetical protein